MAQALGDRFRTRLERELLTVPYEPAPPEVGPVRQETDVFVLRDLKGFPALAELAHEYRVAVLARAREIRGLATYAPNEIHLQRYRPGSLGITPHLDGKRYRRLVAFFTVRGSACLSVLRERAGEERCSGLLAWEASATAARSMRSCWASKSASRSGCA